MPDVATVPGDVRMYPGVGQLSQLFVGFMAEDFTQGDAVYQGSDGNYYLADSSTKERSACAGFCTASGKAGQYCSIMPPNALQLSTVLSAIDFGVDLTISMVFVISNNPGKIKGICNIGDGEFVTIVGFAKNYRLMSVIQLAIGIPYNEFVANPGDAMGALGLTYP